MATIDEYFSEVIATAKSQIRKQGDPYILDVDTDDLVKYYETQYGLPTIEKVQGGQSSIQKVELRELEYREDIPVRIIYPVVPKERLNETVVRFSNPTIHTFEQGWRVVIYSSKAHIGELRAIYTDWRGKSVVRTKTSKLGTSG